MNKKKEWSVYVNETIWALQKLKKERKVHFLFGGENIHQIINCKLKRLKTEIVKRYKTAILTEKKKKK